MASFDWLNSGIIVVSCFLCFFVCLFFLFFSMDVPGGGDENDKDKGKEGEGERTRQFYDVGEWENLQKKERGLGLGKTEVKETRVLISDGREVGLFQIPKFRSLPSNLMGGFFLFSFYFFFFFLIYLIFFITFKNKNQNTTDLNLQYFAQRFEKMIADRFGITKNQQFWLESMEDGSITDLGQPWGLKNGGKYWLVLGETKGIFVLIFFVFCVFFGGEVDWRESFLFFFSNFFFFFSFLFSSSQRCLLPHLHSNSYTKKKKNPLWVENNNRTSTNNNTNTSTNTTNTIKKVPKCGIFVRICIIFILVSPSFVFSFPPHHQKLLSQKKKIIPPPPGMTVFI